MSAFVVAGTDTGVSDGVHHVRLAGIAGLPFVIFTGEPEGGFEGG